MKVLVFGATSYIADAFISECERRGWDIVVNFRDSTRWEILNFDRHSNVRILDNEKKHHENVDVAINFAYAKNSRWYESHLLTRKIIQQFISLARNLSARILIQISSLAVFGYKFKTFPRPRKVSLLLGDPYIEGKIIAERLILKSAKNNSYVPVIVRLGNVIGPGAIPWTATLSTYILNGVPVGIGKSNATYVGNIVDYLCYICSTSEEILEQFGPFHHLAEFSGISWKEIIERICDIIGIKPVYISKFENNNHFKLINYLIGYLRFIAGILPPKFLLIFQKIDENIKPYLKSFSFFSEVKEVGFLQVMCETIEFRQHVLPGWVPPFNFDLALERIGLWLKESGYVDQCLSNKVS